MQKRQLGNSGLEVSAIGLGCMGMSMGYGASDDASSIKTLKYAIDHGINFLDTADMYGVAGVGGWGHNENLIGKVLADGYRDKVVIATKCGFVQRKNPEGGISGVEIDGTPQHIKNACDESLKRLKLEVIDLYYLHRGDRNVPIEESVGALSELVKAGKVRYIGMSELTDATLRRAAKVHPITALQSEYSLFHRKPEKGVLPACRELGISFVPYSPLGRGFLSGKVRDISKLDAHDFRRILPRFQDLNLEKNLKIVDSIIKLAGNKNCTPAQFAIAWLLSQGEDIIPIPGTRSIDRLTENMGAADIKLTAEELAEVNRLIPTGAVAGEQYPKEHDFEM